MSVIQLETDKQKRKCLSDLLALVIFAVPTVTRTVRVEQNRRDLLLSFLTDALDEQLLIMGVYARVDSAMNEKNWLAEIVETCVENMKQGISQTDTISIAILHENVRDGSVRVGSLGIWH